MFLNGDLEFLSRSEVLSVNCQIMNYAPGFGCGIQLRALANGL
jgi:hypothetical protein